MVGISSQIEYPTVGFLSVVSLSWYNVNNEKELSLAEFPFSRQTGRQAKQFTSKRSFVKIAVQKTTFECTLVCLSACLSAKWEFHQTQIFAVVESLMGPRLRLFTELSVLA